jgi:hypothetical protein
LLSQSNFGLADMLTVMLHLASTIARQPVGLAWAWVIVSPPGLPAAPQVLKGFDVPPAPSLQLLVSLFHGVLVEFSAGFCIVQVSNDFGQTRPRTAGPPIARSPLLASLGSITRSRPAISANHP